MKNGPWFSARDCAIRIVRGHAPHSTEYYGGTGKFSDMPMRFFAPQEAVKLARELRARYPSIQYVVEDWS